MDEKMVNSSFYSCVRGGSLKGPASKAYELALAPHHGWAIRKAVAAGMYALPIREQLFNTLNEDGECFGPFQMLNEILYLANSWKLRKQTCLED